MKNYKEDFPIFKSQEVIFLDSAASTQKPSVVIDGLMRFYATMYANVHRGSCDLANEATVAYENARRKVADFIRADKKQIIFTKGATESINLVASGYTFLLHEGDEVLVSDEEHHANFVPWQQACVRSGATFKTFRVLPSGEIDMVDYRAKLTERTKIVAVSHLSNVLGVVNPIQELVQMAHEKGARILVDGAQSVAHLPVNVAEIDCDYFAFSGHKLYGPTGIGVLYGKKEALEELPPYQFGGDMIKEVSAEKTTFADLPNKFEAGTPPFAEAVGLGYAIDYLNGIGMEQIEQNEADLTRYLTERLATFSDIEILGNSAIKNGIVSFVVKGIHPSDIAFALGKQHICVRVGHHCAMPIHACFHQTVSIRVSLGVYNDRSDIDAFIAGLSKAIRLFQ